MFVFIEMLGLIRPRKFVLGFTPQAVIPGRHHIVEVVGQQLVPFLEAAVVEQARFMIEELFDV